VCRIAQLTLGAIEREVESLCLAEIVLDVSKTEQLPIAVRYCLSVSMYAGVLDAFTDFRKATFRFDMSVCPHATTRLPPDRISSNLILEDLSKICRETEV
jgi:hypothetical protein